MAYPTNRKRPSPPKIDHTVVNRFLGIDLSKDPSYIDMRRSPDLYNMMPINSIDFEKRLGFKELFPNILPPSTPEQPQEITGMFYNKNGNADIIYFSCSDRKMYGYKISTGVAEGPLPIENQVDFGLIYGDNIIHFNYGDKIYILSHNNMFSIDKDGATFSINGYLPTVAISTPMSGGGVPFEDKNILNQHVQQLFSGNGTDSVAHLMYKNLPDVEDVSVVINGEFVSPLQYSVNSEEGTVDFSAGEAAYGIPEANTNNIMIQYRVDPGPYPDERSKILNCTIADVYGGANDLRIWVSGNPDYPNRDWRSGVQSPTYFPETGYDDIGSPGSAILGYALLYEYQIIIKEDSIHRRNYTFDDSGNSIFPTTWLSRERGANNRESIQMLDGFPVFLGDEGVFMITSVDPQNERNIAPISDRVNYSNLDSKVKGLVDTFKDCKVISFDNKKQYWLISDAGDYWVYDYRQIENGIGEWYRGNFGQGIKRCIVVNGDIYLSYKDKSSIGIRKKPHDADLYSDSFYEYDVEGNPTLVDNSIESYWASKHFNFGNYTHIAFVHKLFIKFKKYSDGGAKIYWRSDFNSNWDLVGEVSAGDVTLFAYSNIIYSTITYTASTFAENFVHKLKKHHVGHGQIMVYNNKANERLSFLSVTFQHMPEREVK